MSIAFDPAKDAMNIAKHGMSLAQAAQLEVLARVTDRRFEEVRYRAYGLLHGVPHCLAYTVRDGVVRAISFRRSHLKEFRRHVR